jgi:hypothetical protein
MSNDTKLEGVVEQFLRHEVQCEERWKTTFNRLDDIDEKLDRMEQRQVQVGGALILFLAGLVVTLAFQV